MAQNTHYQSQSLKQNSQTSLAEKNKKLVLCFYNQFFNQHDINKASQVVAENYKQHNPEVPDGKKPFITFFKDYFKSHPNSHAQIVHSAADGDLVFLHVHSKENEGDLGQAVVDIFRVKNNKIVEHWDVIQSVPKQSLNQNTMF
ncbi:hypothetical protein E3D00_10060 [Swingsia samuiensis]|uniref:SnoaL-like domain-containing protein n=2 Tax=Swingsia samuiensis TaxID=1293412 RepID=A0A4Y6UKJ6_9PROT|nr:hypothetical protein E3D00_10060 [Swingsia samuiensis]